MCIYHRMYGLSRNKCDIYIHPSSVKIGKWSIITCALLHFFPSICASLSNFALCLFNGLRFLVFVLNSMPLDRTTLIWDTKMHHPLHSPSPFPPIYASFSTYSMCCLIPDLIPMYVLLPSYFYHVHAFKEHFLTVISNCEPHVIVEPFVCMHLLGQVWYLTECSERMVVWERFHNCTH